MKVRAGHLRARRPIGASRIRRTLTPDVVRRGAQRPFFVHRVALFRPSGSCCKQSRNGGSPAWLRKRARSSKFQATLRLPGSSAALDWNPADWEGRAHFFAVAAKMMRRTLVNHAAARRRKKRGASEILVSLSEAEGVPDETADLIALDEALLALAEFGRAQEPARRVALFCRPDG